MSAASSTVAADVVEVHVDALGARLRQRRVEVAGAVVDRAVEAELVEQERALLRSARDADDPAAGRLGDLRGQATDRARRGRHEHRLAGLDVRHPAHADHGRQTDVREDRQPDGERHARACAAPSRAAPSASGSVLTIARVVQSARASTIVTRLEAVRPRLLHLGEDHPDHRIAGPQRHDVRPLQLRPHEVARIERQVDRPDQQLAVRRARAARASPSAARPAPRPRLGRGGR